MQLILKRIVLFAPDMLRMTALYRDDVLGLPLRIDEPGFKEFDAGGCGIALHNGSSKIGARPPKLNFWSDDVAATREALIARGAKLGKVMAGPGLTRCEGKEPDRNHYQISN